MSYNNDCHNCVNKRNVPGDTHISCVNPSKCVSGSAYGIKNGWFLYPFNFDPIWHTTRCPRFLDKKYEGNEFIEIINESLIKIDEKMLLGLNKDWYNENVHEDISDKLYDYVLTISEIVKESKEKAKNKASDKAIKQVDDFIAFLKEKFEKTTLEKIKELLNEL